YVTLVSACTVRVHVCSVPEQAPAQVPNTWVASGAATRVTFVSGSRWATHVPGQSTPPPVILPPPWGTSTSRATLGLTRTGIRAVTGAGWLPSGIVAVTVPRYGVALAVVQLWEIMTGPAGSLCAPSPNVHCALTGASPAVFSTRSVTGSPG